MTLVFNNTNDCPTKGLEKEDLGLMDVCYMYFCSTEANVISVLLYYSHYYYDCK